MKIIKGYNLETDKEAVRLLSLMGIWIPAFVNGKTNQYQNSKPLLSSLRDYGDENVISSGRSIISFSCRDAIPGNNSVVINAN